MKDYLREGDLVTLNKDIPNKPVMMVHKIKKERETNSSTPFGSLIGIVCIWFTRLGFLQKEEFNFKDLEKIEDDE